MPKSSPLTADQRDLVAHLCAEAGARLERISTAAVTIRGVDEKHLSQTLEQMIAHTEDSALLLKAARCVAQQDSTTTSPA